MNTTKNKIKNKLDFIYKKTLEYLPIGHQDISCVEKTHQELILLLDNFEIKEVVVEKVVTKLVPNNTLENKEMLKGAGVTIREIAEKYNDSYDNIYSLVKSRSITHSYIDGTIYVMKDEFEKFYKRRYGLKD